jgi:glyoxylase-like metal-dependent hydrolase (beta-lactamase superfamily II)
MEIHAKIKVHGRGNAWPIPLGEEHPFYDASSYRDLSNAAFSLEVWEGEELKADILVDAGHGTVQSIISGANRIPHCICLTHGHMDHTLSVDWVVQSFWRRHDRQRRYPLYATLPVFRFLIASYPHLDEMLDFRELQPGEPRSGDLPGGISLTSYPVYHGPHARGASMLLFRTGKKKVLFTGDLFTPLLREADYGELAGADLVVVDSNNRFPWPRTNHWSFSGSPENPLERDPVLRDFLKVKGADDFQAPHLGEASPAVRTLLDQVKGEWEPARQPFSVIEFCLRIRPRKLCLVHYSGSEDRKYHGRDPLNTAQLEEWAIQAARASGLPTEVHVPLSGEEISI